MVRRDDRRKFLVTMWLEEEIIEDRFIYHMVRKSGAGESSGE
jgi:hypothetical protein